MSDGPLPVGWTSRFLGECLEKLKSGKRVERGWSPQCLNHPIQNEGEWGVLKTTAVQMGEYQSEHNKALPSSAEPKRGLMVEDGDFLLTTTGPRSRCGVVCLARRTPGNLIFSGKILRFRANQSIALSSWLQFALMSPVIQETLNGLKVGTSDSSVSIGNQQVLDLQVSVPPIAEQEKIVEILEEQLARLDAVVKSVQTVREKAAQFRRSLHHAAFTGQLSLDGSSIRLNPQTWPQVELESLVVDCQPGFASGKHNSEGRGVIHIRPMNISRKGVLDFSELKYVDVEGGHRLGRGDVLFNNTNSPALVGKTTFIDSDTELAFSNHMTRLRVDRSKILPEYLALRLHSLWEEGYFEEICSNHVNQASVSSRRLMKVAIEVPEVSVQDGLVRLVKARKLSLDVALTVCDEVERKAAALRRSLLHAAFSGELTRSWREVNV